MKKMIFLIPPFLLISTWLLKESDLFNRFPFSKIFERLPLDPFLAVFLVCYFIIVFFWLAIIKKGYKYKSTVLQCIGETLVCLFFAYAGTILVIVFVALTIITLSFAK